MQSHLTARMLSWPMRKIGERRQRTYLQFLTDHDPLTGLIAYARLVEEAAAILAKPFKSPWPLALHRIGFAPLGHSRDVREVEGHDALIVAFAERLAGVVGPDHGLARVDGRNFIVAQNVRTPQTIIKLASEMLEAMAASYRVGTQAFDVAVNVGSAIAPVHGQSVERLDKSAALALKHSRARGPNVVSVFDLSMEEPDLTGQRPDSRPGYHRAAS